MARNPFSDTQGTYDRLIKQIRDRLENLFKELLKDKKEHKTLRNTIAHKLHAEKVLYVTNRRELLNTRMAEGSHPVTDEQLKQLDALQSKLEELILREIEIERREAIQIQNDPARIDDEIKEIDAVLTYIRDEAGSPNKRRSLNTEAMYNRIVNVYKSVLTRKEEAELTKKFEGLKEDIEKQANEIINRINVLIESIPEGGPSGAGPSGAGPSGGPSGGVPGGSPDEVDIPIPTEAAGEADVQDTEEPIDIIEGVPPEEIIAEIPPVVPFVPTEATPAVETETGGPTEVIPQQEVGDIKDDVDAAVEVLDKQRGWFERAWEPLKGIMNLARSKLNPKSKLSQARKLLKKVKYAERREQWTASVRKARSKLRNLLRRHSTPDEAKKDIIKLEEQEGIYESDALVETVQGIGEELEKPADEVDWKKVEQDVEKVEQDIQAIVSVDKGLKVRLGQISARTVAMATGVVPGWLKNKPNPIPALRNWWANAASTAKRLKGKIGKADITGEQIEAGGEADTAPEANRKLQNLFVAIAGVRKFSPKESKKLVGLGERLKGAQSTISENLKKLKMPGIGKKDAEGAAEKIEGAATDAGETAVKIEQELSRWGRIKTWLQKSRTPSIDLRGPMQNARTRFAGAMAGAAGAPKAVKGTLGNWWSTMSKNAGNLANAAQSKANIGSLVGNVRGFGERNLQKVNANVTGLINNARSIVKMPSVDIRARERISGLATQLSSIQTSITNKIGNLRQKLSTNQVGEIASKIKIDSEQAKSIAERLRAELGKVGGAVGRVAGAPKAVKGTLENWWSALSSNAGNLAASRAPNLGGIVRNVKAFGGRNLQSVNTNVTGLINNARSIVKMPSVDIRARERISGLATQLSSIQNGITENVKKLKPGLPKTQIEGIANQIREKSAAATGIAGQLSQQLGKIGVGAGRRAAKVKGGIAGAVGGALRRLRIKGK